MKNTLYTMALVTAALAAVSGAQAQTWNYDGDIVLGFSRGTGNDVLFNLGRASGLASGDLSSYIDDALLAANGYTTGFKFGAAASDWSNSVLYSSKPSGAPAPAEVNGGFTVPAAALFNTGAFIVGPGNSATAPFSDLNGWTKNMVTPEDLSGSGFWTAYGDVNATYSGSPTVLDFYSAVDTMPVEQIGTFTLSNVDGDFSLSYAAFTPVPEPSTVGLLAGAGLLALGLRRRLAKA